MKAALLAHGLLIVVAIAGIVGWISNLVQLFHASFDPLTGMVVLRIIGVFIPPLGSVLGYL